MDFKTVLPGVVLLSFAGSALAGEPVLVEPEPAESVKSCEKYGSGFVYVPGTDTCVKISGEVRTTYTHNSVKRD